MKRPRSGFRRACWCALGLAAASSGLFVACQREAEAPSAVSRPADSPGAEVPSAPERSETAAPVPVDPAPSQDLNLVIITMDTTRADALGAYGQPLPTSPNLDRLAQSGTQFLQCVTSAPSTLPSHSTIFTGKQPYVHGARANAGYVLSEDNTTLAEVLKADGYATGAEVAAPVIGAQTQLDQGFDHYRDLNFDDIRRKIVTVETESGPSSVEIPERDAADITRHGIRFLQRHRDEKFFLWLHYFDAHQPYSPPPRIFGELPESAYHGEVRYVDQQINRVLTEIEDLGLRGRTLVVITADHGEGLKEHDEGSHTYFVYDTTMRVPLLLWGADVPRGLKIDSLVRTVDIAPTLLDWLHLPALENAQGVSLRPLITGESHDLELTGYGESLDAHTVFGTSIIRFLREGRWKYIHKIEPQLFDVEKDPHELRNLASDQPEIVERLRARLFELIAAAPASPADSRSRIDEAEAAQLEALGYIAAAPKKLGDELALLELDGLDPTTKLDDIRLMGEGAGFQKTQRYAPAADRYRQVVERNPESAVALARLASVLADLDLEDERLEVTRQWVALKPETADAYVQLARLYFDRGDRAGAERLLTEALTVDPCAPSPRATLAHLAARARDHSRQIRLLREGVEQCSPPSSLLNNYAYALATNPEATDRDGPEALRISLQITRGKDGDRADFLDTLASAQAEVGDFESAVATAKRAVALLEAAGESASEARAHVELFAAGRPVREE